MAKITGLTTCVGEHYAQMLSKSLPIWKDTLDSLRIVTDFQTSIGGCIHSAVYSTDIFTQYGASFNKGAALSYGFATIDEPEWILNFDSDIIPPENWRAIVEPKLSVGKLHGCSHRYRENGSLIPDADYPNIWGFFHLWHTDDPHSWKRPVFDPTCGHAGNYDHSFMMQWEPSARVDLWPELKLIHQGEPRQQWFGSDPKNPHKMRTLFTLGLWDAWATRAGHIKAPEPKHTLIERAEFLTLGEIRQILKEWTDPDPFKYRLEIKCDTSAAASTK